MYNNGTVSNSTTTNYTYGDANWGALLTGYDGEGISYDAIGNPLSYYNGKRYTFSWLYGRRLASSVVDGKTTTYTYNTEGLRLTKTASGVVHTYYWDGSTLLMEKWGNSYLRFLYDESGAPLRMEYYNGSTTTVYYYVLNLQGDVLEIRDTSNNVVCRYSYDAWGKLLSVKDGSGNAITSANHIGILNPLRYRGYYYDTETGLYYLQSRYYDPQVGRFISPDTYISTGQGMLGYNMYAYCLNNPVALVDKDGELAIEISVIGGYLLKGLFALVGAGVAIEASDEIADGIGVVWNTLVDGVSEVGSWFKGKSKTKDKEDAKSAVAAITKEPPSNGPTYIYRYGGTNPSNLLPTQNDVNSNSGLSFSLIPRIGAAKTTIEEINATGILFAVIDGGVHVSVYPIGATIEEWRACGTSSVWTQTLRRLVVKCKGL